MFKYENYMELNGRPPTDLTIRVYSDTVAVELWVPGASFQFEASLEETEGLVEIFTEAVEALREGEENE